MSENTVSANQYMRTEASITGAADRSSGPIDRIAVKLADPAWQPDRAQVAWLIDAAFRCGRDCGLAEAAELNLDALSAASTAPQWSAQALTAAERVARHRAECDARARVPRDGDHP